LGITAIVDTQTRKLWRRQRSQESRERYTMIILDGRRSRDARSRHCTITVGRSGSSEQRSHPCFRMLDARRLAKGLWLAPQLGSWQLWAPQAPLRPLECECCVSAPCAIPYHYHYHLLTLIMRPTDSDVRLMRAAAVARRLLRERVSRATGGDACRGVERTVRDRTTWKLPN
jgi:hypothetical protein